MAPAPSVPRELVLCLDSLGSVSRAFPCAPRSVAGRSGGRHRRTAAPDATGAGAAHGRPAAALTAGAGAAAAAAGGASAAGAGPALPVADQREGRPVEGMREGRRQAAPRLLEDQHLRARAAPRPSWRPACWRRSVSATVSAAAASSHRPVRDHQPARPGVEEGARQARQRLAAALAARAAGVAGRQDDQVGVELERRAASLALTKAASAVGAPGGGRDHDRGLGQAGQFARQQRMGRQVHDARTGPSRCRRSAAAVKAAPEPHVLGRGAGQLLRDASTSVPRARQAAQALASRASVAQRSGGKLRAQLRRASAARSRRSPI